MRQVVQKMERETGLEPVTSSLGSWHSTTELLPLNWNYKYSKSKVAPAVAPVPIADPAPTPSPRATDPHSEQINAAVTAGGATDDSGCG
jgi:hypothetical protein